MGTWITTDKDYVLGAMPTALRATYDAWIIANPTKNGRVAALAAGVVADFRAGLARGSARSVSERTAFRRVVYP